LLDMAHEVEVLAHRGSLKKGAVIVAHRGCKSVRAHWPVCRDFWKSTFSYAGGERWCRRAHLSHASCDVGLA
jgi:hypothetical protein